MNASLADKILVSQCNKGCIENMKDDHYHVINRLYIVPTFVIHGSRFKIKRPLLSKHNTLSSYVT